MSARRLAFTALREWMASQRFADAIVQALLSAHNLATADRAFALELFYGTIRQLRLLDFWIGALREKPIDDDARALLRLGLYQLLILHTPSHAAVYETVQLASVKQRPLINGILRSAQRRRPELLATATTRSLGVRTSHPDFLVTRWQKAFGELSTVALCEWNNRPPPVYARVNKLKISPEDFLRAYPTAVPVPVNPDFVQLQDFREPIALGHCYIQDPSTTMACELLGSLPGERVLDACAAPGGKTAILAQQMQNRGAITATDRDAQRLDRLQENLDQLGVSIATISREDWSNVPNESAPTYDRILLDAPCSNTGVMRRRVDVRWRLQPDDFARMQERQIAITRAVLPYLKPGGTFVYSTCSLEPEENESVAARICDQFPGLKLEAQKALLPFHDQCDGAFAVKFYLSR